MLHSDLNIISDCSLALAGLDMLMRAFYLKIKCARSKQVMVSLSFSFYKLTVLFPVSFHVHVKTLT